MLNNTAQKPLVTIAIPSYKREEKLKRALLSAIKQSYSNIEILVSNNDPFGFSSVEQFMGENNNDNIIYYKQKKNIGLAQNFAFLLSKARGEYFMWLCDDDWIDKNYIETLVRGFEKCCNCGLSVSDIKNHSYDLKELTIISTDLLQNRNDYMNKTLFYLKNYKTAWMLGLFKLKYLKKIYSEYLTMNFYPAMDRHILEKVILDNKLTYSKGTFYHNVNKSSNDGGHRPNGFIKYAKWSVFFIVKSVKQVWSMSHNIGVKSVLSIYILYKNILLAYKRPFFTFVNKIIK